MGQKSEESFLQRRLKLLVAYTKDIEKFTRIHEGVYNDVHSWTSLKLIYLDYIASFYSNIMKKSPFRDKFYFIDLFSGSGIGRVTDSKNDLIFGSPLLIGQREFTKMFFCDNNVDYCNALTNRLSAIPKTNFEIYPKDCNLAIDEIINQVKEGHSLIFIDPYGMEISWQSMEKILKLNADILFNFQTPEIARGIAHGGKITNAAKTFFGEDGELTKIYENGYIIGDQLIDLYRKKIFDVRSQSVFRGKKQIILTSAVEKGDDRFFYELLFITRETAGGSPWLNGIRKATNDLEHYTGKDAKIALSVLNGRQRALFSSV